MSITRIFFYSLVFAYSALASASDIMHQSALAALQQSSFATLSSRAVVCDKQEVLTNHARQELSLQELISQRVSTRSFLDEAISVEAPLRSDLELTRAEEAVSASVGSLLPQSSAVLQSKEQSVKNPSEQSAASDIIPWSEFLYAGHARYTIDGMEPYRNSHVNYLALSATGGVYLGIMVGLHIYQANTFWSQRSSFITVREDGSYAKGVDKFGHVFGATLMSYYSTEVLQGSGVSVESAHIWGTLMGLMYQTYVEVEDGYGRDWGFSPTDMYMNVVGASWYLMQYYVPALQNVTEKWIYTPAHWIKEEPRKTGETFIDDYSSSTFFFSFKMHNVLGGSMRSVWPRWLNLAVGYAARGLDTPKEDQKVIIALDYDLPEVLPDFRQTIGGWLGDVCNWLGQSFNYVKLPSPAIEIGAHGMTRFNLLYPFKLNIGRLKF